MQAKHVLYVTWYLSMSGSANTNKPAEQTLFLVAQHCRPSVSVSEHKQGACNVS
jgi:hypothetical protein